MKLRLTAILVCALGSTTLHAYELATHARVTEAAYERSVLSDPKFLKELGIDANDPEPFGIAYYDVSGTELRERERNAFERKFMPDNARPLSVSGWLMRGAIREDDAYKEDNPQDDTFNPTLRRPLHHFFDPVNNRPLTVPGIDLLDAGIHTAPAWALGTTNANAFTRPYTAEIPRRNHFTLLDAREAMYRALTGRDTDGNEVAKTKEDRNKYWATTFRALGDVVHLIQDMAQPQHTRNDQHAGKFPERLTGHASVYEKYIEARATGSTSYTFDGKAEEILPLTDKDYTGYVTPAFPRAADYFSTREGPQGRGLADYSNRGFFSAGSNLGHNDYPLPANDRNAYRPRVVSIEPTVETSLLEGEVPDTLTGTPATGVPLTTESAWYQPLQDFASADSERLGYTLTRANYDAMAALLLPRAVAYSAGMIDYFFRGRLAAEDAEFSETGVSLRVRNAIDGKHPDRKAEVLYAQDSQGRSSSVVLAYEYMLNGQTVIGSSQPVPLAESLAPGEVSKTGYTFVLPAFPAAANDMAFRLVFRGRLGEEDVSVAVAKIEPVSGFLVKPNYVPQDGIPGARALYSNGGQWRLSEKQGLVAGNIDWKGWYVNGRATKVLSWNGPRLRYFPSGEAFSNAIYQNGELFAVAPLSVLGAAVTKDTDGKEWIVAICAAGSDDVVYRRPNAKSNDPSLFDATDSPDGWEVLATFPAVPEAMQADRPWLFNGSGTEAQTLRRMTNGGTTRLKIRLMGSAVDMTSSGNTKAVSTTSYEIRNQNCEGSGGGENPPSVYGRRETKAAGSTIVAVDYRDDKEILATIELSSLSTWVAVGIYGDAGEDYSVNSSHNKTTKLRFGTVSVALGSEEHLTQQRSLWGVEPEITQTSTTSNQSSSIVFLDLRHEFVLLSSNSTSRVYAFTGGDGSGAYGYTDTSGCSYSLRHDSAEKTIFEISDSKNGSGTLKYDTLDYFGDLKYCYDNPYFNREESATSETESFLNAPLALYAGAYGVDTAGNLAVSMQYLEKGATRYFKELTGSAFEQAIPVAPENAFYSEIKVLK